MNRKIKFRVWHKKGKEWCGILYPNATISPHALEYEEEDLIFCQFTGLKDSKGNEIFEGDILNQLLDNKPCYYIVEWGNQADYCGFVLRPIMKRDGTSRTTVHDFKIYLAEGFEIIGNVYQNPDLLCDSKKKKLTTPQNQLI